MLIGEAALITGIREKTLRYLEQIGMVVPERHTNGYRRYTDCQIEQLRVYQRARNVGFTTKECRNMLAVAKHGGVDSGQVRQLVGKKLNDIDNKLSDLQKLRLSITNYAHNRLSDTTSMDPGRPN